MTQEQTSQRKTDHIDLALKSQLANGDNRFYYEPLLSAHPSDNIPVESFLGKEMKVPMWVSSMTGGTEHAGRINKLLAEAAGKFGLGMGLGSCRIILEDNTYLPDFQMRKFAGDSVPLFANLGIAQIEELLNQNKHSLILDLIDKTETDGLIIHINPFQEWLQPEGDHITKAPILSIRKIRDLIDIPIIVKEVGQGMGPESIKALLKLGIDGLDFGAFGGTNFSVLELLRADENAREGLEPLTKIGHSALEMVGFVNELIDQDSAFSNTSFIISGGVRNFLDGYYLKSKLKGKSVYAHASQFLKYADKGESELHDFISQQISGYALATNYLKIRE